ncbi:MAG TPA: hypothetical protein PKA94_13655, partial [Ferruginibacter sp.]|nr:hypothetical protein [Ferruginibacter sp.]
MVVTENISLKSYNTFGVDARARRFARFESVEQLQEILDHDQQQSRNDQPVTRNSKPQPLILGGGSNLLFTGNVD